MLLFRNLVAGLALLTVTVLPIAALSQDVGVDAGVDAGVAAGVVSETAVAEPTTTDEAVQLVVKAVDLALAGQWLLLAILLIQLGVFAVKKYASKGFMKTWGSVSVGGMAAVIAFLSGLVGGLSWQESLIVFLSGPASSLTVDFLHAMGWLDRKVEDA